MGKSVIDCSESLRDTTNCGFENAPLLKGHCQVGYVQNTNIKENMLSLYFSLSIKGMLSISACFKIIDVLGVFLLQTTLCTAKAQTQSIVC